MTYSLVNYFGEVIGEEFETFEEAQEAAVKEFDTTGISERSVVMFCGKIEDKDGVDSSEFELSETYQQLQEELKQGREAIEELKRIRKWNRIQAGIPENYEYGFCPKCGGPGVKRERRPNGNDTCINKHQYPSSTAIIKEEESV